MGKWIDIINNRNTVLDSNTQPSSTLLEEEHISPFSSVGAKHPTPCDICVPDDVKVLESLPDSLPEKVAEGTSSTRKLGSVKVSGGLPDTLPRVLARTTAAVCFDLLEAPPTRTEAVERLVVTFRPEIHEEQRQRWLTTTLSGKPVSDAPESYLLAEAVGLTAWAQDREDRGVFNRGAYEWITAAWQAVERRAHHLKVA